MTVVESNDVEGIMAEKELSVVLVPRTPVPSEGQDPSRPARMPEFWQREHSADIQCRPAQVRARPYVLRGRDHETAFVAKRIHGMPFPVQLIAGQPGAGKTALLRNVRRYAAAQGYLVIHLLHSAFESDALLADAIRNVTDPNQRTPVAATITEGESSGLPATIAERTATATTARAHRTDEAWQWENAILAEARNPEHNGLLITLDEVQLLQDHAEATDQYERIKSFLQFMHNSIVEDDRTPRARAMLICAGLLNSTDTLLYYKLTRVEGKDILRLGPLSDAATSQVIMDHMTADTGKGRPLPQLPKDTLHELIGLCGGYPHHISHAAQNAQRQAMDSLLDGRDNMTAEELSRIIAGTVDAKVKHYGGRVRENTNRSIAEPVRIIAQATETWGDQLPVERTVKLIRRIASEGVANSTNLLADMIGAGILEYRRPGEDFPTLQPGTDPRPHYVFPIHSMQTWLLQELDATVDSRETRSANQRIIDACGGPIPEAERIPNWQWDDTQALPRLRPMPSDEPWQPTPTDTVQRIAPAHEPGRADQVFVEAAVGTAQTAKALAEPRVRGWFSTLRDWATKQWRGPKPVTEVPNKPAIEQRVSRALPHAGTDVEAQEPDSDTKPTS